MHQKPAAHCWRRRCCPHHQLHRRTAGPENTRCRPRYHRIPLCRHQPRASPHRLHHRPLFPPQACLRRHCPRHPCHQRRHHLLVRRHHRPPVCQSPRRPCHQRRHRLLVRRHPRPSSCLTQLQSSHPRHPCRCYPYTHRLWHQAQLLHRICHLRSLRGRPCLRPSSRLVRPT